MLHISRATDASKISIVDYMGKKFSPNVFQAIFFVILVFGKSIFSNTLSWSAAVNFYLLKLFY